MTEIINKEFLENKRTLLTLKYNKINKIGWLLEIPSIVIILLAVILSFVGVGVIVIVLFFFNLGYLFVHLIFFGIIEIRFHLKLKETFTLKEPQSEKTFYTKCAYCGYETPNQFKKCSHCGAIL